MGIVDSLRTSKGVLGAKSLQLLLGGVESLVHVNLAWFVLLVHGWVYSYRAKTGILTRTKIMGFS